MNIKRAIITIFTVLAVSLLYAETVRAEGGISTVPRYVNDNYDYKIIYPVTNPITGSFENTVYEDISCMDELYISLCMYAGKCKNCGNPSFAHQNEFYIRTGYTDLFHVNRIEYYGDSKPDYWWTATYPFATKNQIPKNQKSKVIFHLAADPGMCLECKTWRPMTVKFEDIVFIDRRGTATFKQSGYIVNKGDTLTVDPAYNEYAKSFQWAVKFPGETAFTPLTEGENSHGLVASGVTNASVTISNIPYVVGGFDLGVFVYDDDGQLPAGTSYPLTPFYTRIMRTDFNGPSVSVEKIKSADGKSVTAKINASDDEGLHAKPYSWDGGSSYSEQSSKNITKTGTYQVAVRDAAGNVTKTSFYVDSSDLSGTGSGSSGASGASGGSVNDKTTSSGSGSGSGSSSGGSSGSGGTGGTSGMGTGYGGLSGNGTSGTGTGSMSDIKNGGANDSVTGGNVSGSGGSSSSGSGTGKGLSGSTDDTKTGKASGKNSSSSDSLKPSADEGESSDEVFERIRNNSHDYIIAMHDSYTEEEMGASPDDAEIDIKSVSDEEDIFAGADLKLTDGEDSGMYKPGALKDSPYFIPLVILMAVILALILAYVLFFGVLILAEKETELSKISLSEGIKVPVGLSHVAYKDGRFSVCVRELLNKYNVLYLKCGVLFVYMYDGEKIGIATKFNADKKREIAVETIHSEIKVGGKQ